MFKSLLFLFGFMIAVLGVGPPSSAAGPCPTSGTLDIDETFSFTHRGVQRIYHTYADARVDQGTPTPLVITFHGWRSDAKHQQSISGLADVAGDPAFMEYIAVYPEGLGKTWKAEDCCGSAHENDVDDIGFIKPWSMIWPQEPALIGKRSVALACQMAESWGTT